MLIRLDSKDYLHMMEPLKLNFYFDCYSKIITTFRTKIMLLKTTIHFQYKKYDIITTKIKGIEYKNYIENYRINQNTVNTVFIRN